MSTALSGAAFMVTASVLLGALDAVAKVVGGTYPVTEVVWFRYAGHLALAFALFAPSRGRSLFRTRAPIIQAARSLLLLTTTVLFFVALQYLPLAETAAITFSSPLITLSLAPALLGESFSSRRLLPAAVGFCGVIAVVQPWSATVSAAVLLPLAAAVTASMYAILTRWLGAKDDPGTTWVYTGFAGAVVMLAFAPFGWQLPDLLGLGLLTSLGVLGGLGHLAIINAYGRAPASLIAPLGYLELAWATVLGIVLFSEVPDVLAAGGIAVIALSGVLVAGNSRRASETSPPER